MKWIGLSFCGFGGWMSAHYGLPVTTLGYWLVVIPTMIGGIIVGNS